MTESVDRAQGEVAERPSVMVVGTGRSFNLYNRASAVNSMLCSALDVIAQQFTFSINGEPFRPSAQRGEIGMGVARSQLERPSSIAKLLPRQLRPLLREALEERNRTRLLARLSEAARPDAVLELYRIGSSVGAALASTWRVPLLIYFDAPEIEQYADIHGEPPPLAGRAIDREERSLRQADRIVVYSEHIKEYLVQRCGISQSRIAVFQTLDHSRMTARQPAPPSTRPVIGYVGSFMHWHRVPMLVQSFASLRRSGVDAQLLLIGDGLGRREVERAIDESGQRAFIEITGFLDGERLQSQKSRIDVAVLPGTRWYNLPTKIFEYGAASIPTIAPRSPTVESLFGITGEVALFPEGDAEGLRKLLQRSLEDQQWRLALGHALAHRVATQHTPEHTRLFYASLIRELASRGERPSAFR